MGELVKKSASNIELRKTLALPVTPGKYFRLVFLTGPQKGSVYYLKGDRIILGRGNSADVLIRDMMSSREHLELKRLEDGYVLTDLGSNNGTLVNDKKVVQHPLKPLDKIIIGKTVLKYDVNDVHSTILQNSTLQEGEKQKGKTDSKKRIVYLVTILFAILFLIDDKETPKKEAVLPTRSNNEFGDTFRSDQRMQENSDRSDLLESEIDMILQRGKREYREKNYFRAISEFNMALIMEPSNGDAAFFLRKASGALDNEIRTNLIKVQYEKSALKYKEAIVSYCTIVRLIHNFSDNEYYAKLRESIAYELAQLEQKMGLREGEIKCFEESEAVTTV